MFTLLILFAFIAAGFLLRHSRLPHIPSGTASAIVWILLFLFGISIGSNPDIIGRIDRYGLQALVLATGGIAGSAFGAMILWRIIKRHRRL